MSNPPWYKQVSGGDLQQGDIFRRYPIITPAISSQLIQEIREGGSPEIQSNTALSDLVVMSQSCDLDHDKVDTVILCPLWELDHFETEMWPDKSPKEITKFKEDIRRGNVEGFHMLNSQDDMDIKLSVVEFRRIISTPKTVLAEFAESIGNRPRLLPPYREHLSQSFARYFMRVGLPGDIPPFKK